MEILQKFLLVVTDLNAHFPQRGATKVDTCLLTIMRDMTEEKIVEFSLYNVLFFIINNVIIIVQIQEPIGEVTT